MQRHEALKDLSRDHFVALNRAKELREAGTDEGDLGPKAALERFLAFWDREGALHFREEEDVFLPIYQRRVDIRQDGDVRQMLADHAWFRDRVPALRAGLEAGDVDAEAVREVGDRLKRHARLEERSIFEAAQEALTEEDLADLEERGEAFRRKHRPDAIGPR